VKELGRDIWALGNTGINIPDMRSITEFLDTYCIEEINELAIEYPEKHSMYIKHKDVWIYSEGLCKAFEEHFSKIEPIIRQALADTKALKCRTDNIELLENVRIRVSCVMPSLKQTIRNLGTKDIGKLVCVDGYARLVSDTEPRSKVSYFECLRCGHITEIHHNGDKFIEPSYCEDETCGKKGPFSEIESPEGYVDSQRMQIQELPDFTTGTKTQDIIVECEDDLTNIVRPGDRITVIGILKLKPKFANGARKTINEKTIFALSIEKQDLGFEDYILSQDDEDKIIELSQDPDIETKIIESIAPSIYGNEDIKEAIALQLMGGVKKILPDGTVQRGDLNIGLIGDPGGAKTRFLRRAVQISPRGVYASGRSTSAAGLTAAAVKDPLNDGSWILEGGAAVMASGGILAIDEIGQAKEEDKSALHEVMENGTISVAKAGNVTTLKAECGIIMAGNPINGYFDRYSDFAKQMGIPPALWSRLGLVFIMLDEPEEKRDTAIANHILNSHRIGGMIQNKDRAKNPTFSESDVQEAVNEIEAPIPELFLRKYIAYARINIYPVASKPVLEEITGFYNDVRRLKLDKPDSPVPITPRTIEDLYRLSEAHARMRLSNEITSRDVKAAKRLIIVSLKQVGMDEHGRLDANVLYGGRSKSLQDKTTWVFEAIRIERFEGPILERMKVKHGVEEGDVKAILKELSKKGKIFRDADEYKTV